MFLPQSKVSSYIKLGDYKGEFRNNESLQYIKYTNKLYRRNILRLQQNNATRIHEASTKFSPIIG